MGTTVAAYQPHYLPRLHYLARAQEADVFVVYDDVQFVRGSPHHRAAIELGDDEWLTVPVQHTGVDTPLVEARIDMSTPWTADHLGTLRAAYGEQALELAPFYERLCPPVLDVTFVREQSAEVLAVVDGDGDVRATLGAFAEADRRWRDERRALNELQAEKNDVAARIAARKRADPTASIDDLTESVADIDARLETVEATCGELKRRRDDLLVELSEQVVGHGATTDDVGVATDGLDVATDGCGERSDSELTGGPLEWMPRRNRWDLDSPTLDARLEGVAITDLTVPLLEELLRRFDVKSDVVRSSELDVTHPGDASEYLARLTEALGGDCYLSGGTGYESYLDETPFDERGCDVVVQDWDPTWPDGNVCALDVLYGSDDPGAYVR